ncbi:DNA replication/checkpoint protein [Tricharina praecox]|uniref:DNA replication/checkpoint protein n=1 Tax=Tricharina praecox TaxID=43433 RepID=UPI0022210B90|nr:DNA replication/checkpoint protein [Tricharina praecox]KAI5855392.1 DNA replication/checkpoint protein [Tricharina praecox]
MPSDPPPTEPSKSERITKLRVELKDWEHAFAKAHDGRKPTRDETKADREIAAKYKEYARLRSGSSSSSTSTDKKKSSPVSRPATAAAPAPAAPTAPSPTALTQTPTKNPSANPWSNSEIYESPLSIRRQRLFGRRDQVGPTPQKTGKVLGIFDSFIDVESTPPRSAKRLITGLGTPTKSGGERVSVSPALSTPRKRKLAEVAGKKDDIFATPSALREWKPREVAEEDGADSPRVRRPPPMPKRGLSSMLRELREMEAHALDDDEEAMREMEMEAAGLEVPKRKEKKKDEPLFDEVELPPLPPGAFVEDTLQDSDDGKENDGTERKVWKKKGLKRQHRRVISTLSTPSSLLFDPGTQAGDNEAEEAEEAEAAAAEGGDDQPPIPSDIENGEDSSSDDDEEDSKKKSKKKPAAAAEKAKKPAATRKIDANATSHMNFRKLNIKNKNSKGKRGGRFGGGRRR